MAKYLLVVSLLLTAKLYAQSIITDRPDQTESSSTVLKGSLQIESGLLLGFTEQNSQMEREILAPTTLFRYGISHGIEIRILNQFESVKNQSTSEGINGISDLEFGTKFQLLHKNSIEIAFLAHLIIPTGSTHLTNDQWGTINKLAVSHPINENIGLGYNLGYNYFGIGKGDLTYSMALGIGITERVAVYVESYGEVVEFDNHLAKFDAGFTYLLRDHFQLDFSFGSGINYTMNYLSVGVSIYFGNN